MKTKANFIDQLDQSDWARAEFESAPLVDRRLNKRLSSLASDFARHPGAPIPQACQSDPKIKGAYRFIENDFIEPEQILLGHQQASLARWAAEKVVLAPQDTTSFNFSSLKQTTGLGPIGTHHQPGARGLWLHSTQTFTPEGLPLGLVSAQFWSRPDQPQDGRTRHQKSLAEKETVRWRQSWQACQKIRAQMPLGALWVNITDMEGDIYEVLAAAQAQEAPRVELLVRARHDRKLDRQDRRLWHHLASQPVAATLQVRVPRRPGQPPRLALLSIRYCEVRLQAPERQTGQPALHLWAVEAREMHPPAGAGPILWRLLSTVAVTTAQEAIQIVGWYAVRWKIEVFHKIVKSVCRSEDYQLERAQRLQRVLMIDLVVAWRIQVLTQVGRQNPDLPATDYFAEAEWRALASYMHGQGGKLESPPRLGQMMHWIGRLGGFVRCKANPNPGPITLARGLARLNDLTTMYVLQNAIKRSVQW